MSVWWYPIGVYLQVSSSTSKLETWSYITGRASQKSPNTRGHFVGVPAPFTTKGWANLYSVTMFDYDGVLALGEPGILIGIYMPEVRTMSGVIMQGCIRTTNTIPKKDPSSRLGRGRLERLIPGLGVVLWIPPLASSATILGVWNRSWIIGLSRIVSDLDYAVTYGTYRYPKAVRRIFRLVKEIILKEHVWFPNWFHPSLRD